MYFLILLLFRLIDHLPLEQGLRPRTFPHEERYRCLIDHLPLEQGLRQPVDKARQAVVRLIDHLPLEQGLRQEQWREHSLPHLRS